MNVYSLLAAQRRLWCVTALKRASSAYNSTYLLRCAGPLDRLRIAGTPFDLRGPLRRAAVLHFDATTDVLVLVVRHIADG